MEEIQANRGVREIGQSKMGTNIESNYQVVQGKAKGTRKHGKIMIVPERHNKRKRKGIRIRIREKRRKLGEVSLCSDRSILQHLRDNK